MLPPVVLLSSQIGAITFALDAKALPTKPVKATVVLPNISNPLDDAANTVCDEPLYGKLNPIGKLPTPTSSPIEVEPNVVPVIAV